MRLNLAFAFLLVTASTAVSAVWRSLETARAGEVAAVTVVLAGVAIGLAASVLLARIVVKVSAARRAARES